jgi:DNA-binding GntR family transcriptional regulator
MSVTWGDFRPRPSQVWYVALADWIEDQIRAGNLRPGDRLPPQREMATLTGTSFELVNRAMAVLRDRGLVETSVRGSFVR